MATQLPKVTDPNFRTALKEARLAANLSFRELAKRVGIHEVMPSRYENAEHSNATFPGLKTWEKLNGVLFPDSPPVANVDSPPTATATYASETLPNARLLRDAPIDEIVAELKRRGAASVSINW
ncbi:helix-turn-helix family protein [Paraburkholderia xenovorans LB400]|uniref:Transcriptional regulator, XRE family n=1 Tax=Paraburkholderia xenovorans (strain LB400) TaxID=266265 RepID=Q13JB5_PARXL|nr:helix-turn-helix transcriptional regulator [Paraburkholderia xenovorans]ABE35824.1 Putative transcriptional regulator, XRE family [Paraburkholderia xenovorans LB400]AIP36395.1 helix-turn-helix family protein [Paraburkholderia xenovorans LB400]